jgi:hypothetical protein
LNLGNALRGAGRWIEARAELERARVLDARLVAVSFNLGVLYYAATEVDGLDRIGRLKESKKHFVQYSNEMGIKLAKNDPVHKYLEDIQLEVTRLEESAKQAAAQAAADAERAKAREAAAAQGGTTGAAGTDEEGFEDAEGGGEGAAAAPAEGATPPAAGAAEDEEGWE